ncbi:hypothetical protein DVH24_037976 [Malus domestica]|uniref:Uncharacterized protein n=1 Tax=Malus domestica TaxID=3750 RepID=A0A498JZI7_MALDO|nr:hypothetical protein DVH24_037976 [Malus domestica]
MTDLHANLEADANQVPKSRVLAFESKAEPDLSVTVNGLHMPNPFVIGLPPWTNYTVMKRAFDEGWGAAIAKTVIRRRRTGIQLLQTKLRIIFLPHRELFVNCSIVGTTESGCTYSWSTPNIGL